jgi:hypothetical protein
MVLAGVSNNPPRFSQIPSVDSVDFIRPFSPLLAEIADYATAKKKLDPDGTDLSKLHALSDVRLFIQSHPRA